MTDFDIVIVGAGIAGASLAAEISAHQRVLLLEAEAQPGYHATGRSVAFWTESYGGPGVQPLTTASRAFLADPPKSFSQNAFLTRRGALHIGTARDVPLADEMRASFRNTSVALETQSACDISEHVPGVLPIWTIGLWEDSCCDIDVAALHSAYLRMAKRNGVQLFCGAPLTQAVWQGGCWSIECGAGNFTARTLVNAAGAWADDVARSANVEPIGIIPYRRTVLQISVDPVPTPDLPLVIALDGNFYFKPNAGKIWLSPHDETPSPATDAAPDEVDVAIAISRFQDVVDWSIMGLDHKWSGLRSFAPDRLPVIGRDPDVPAFFWFAGQGGFGIQTAPAAAKIAASLLCDAVAPPENVDGSKYLPNRLR
jgi:D-arginine dehydrogenase